VSYAACIACMQVPALALSLAMSPACLPTAVPSGLPAYHRCRWHAAFAENDVLAMTPQILLNLLSHGKLWDRHADFCVCCILKGSGSMAGPTTDQA
jgi:hypothetical protein